jgi:signal transduction histidine kinase
MIYGFIKQCSGCVTVSSEPGKGSVFRVYFPVAENAATASEREKIDSREAGFP